MKYQYRTPSGTLIVGELDVVQCRAEIASFDENGEPEWEGGSEMFWDEQKPVLEDGAIVFLDSEGDEWKLSECTREPLDESEAA